MQRGPKSDCCYSCAGKLQTADYEVRPRINLKFEMIINGEVSCGTATQPQCRAVSGTIAEVLITYCIALINPLHAGEGIKFESESLTKTRTNVEHSEFLNKSADKHENFKFHLQNICSVTNRTAKFDFEK